VGDARHPPHEQDCARREVITWRVIINFDDAGSEPARDFAAGRLAVLVATLKTQFDVDDVIIETEEVE
jgi:hypothetical protein